MPVALNASLMAKTEYAIRGSPHHRAAAIEVLLLHQGDAYRKRDCITRLLELGYHHILLVESPQSYSSPRNSTLRYLLLQNSESLAHQINIGILESQARYVLVLNSSLIPIHTLRHLNSQIAKERLCIAPTLLDKRGSSLPTIHVPVMKSNHLQILQTHSVEHGSRTLFPHAYCGLYHREKFLFLGGYDLAIEQSYWQLCDFGTRAALWGEEIVLSTTYSIQLTTQLATANTTVESAYKRFYLKNILPRYAGDRCTLPLSELLPFVIHFRDGLIKNCLLFLKIRRWVHRHRYRYQEDFRKLIELWDSAL